jgi:16S rRNA (guanine527-N7)-methyltransferase
VHDARAVLHRGLAQLGQPLPERASEQLLDYLALLAKWNRVHNLTAIRDPLKMVSHHLLDSLAVRPHLPPGALADIGSGGGLPGIPLAIAEPDRRVTLNGLLLGVGMLMIGAWGMSRRRAATFTR